jgi:SAM-dependent methyltransferase
MNLNQPVNNSDSAAAYAALARVYDLQHASYTPDVSMYQTFAGECRDQHGNCRILEIGSGTGRVMIPLVEAGFYVVGVDESPQMLEIARQKLAALPAERYQLVQGDMRKAKLEGSFDMAFIALNTFLHNLTRQSQLDMLAAARRYLRPGGILIVDLPPNDELAYQPDDGEYDFEATLVDPSTDTVIEKFVSSLISWADQTQTLSYRIDEKLPTGTHSETVTFNLRHVFKHEMELLLIQSDFNACDWYGDYDLCEYIDGSARMIAVAHV